MRKYVIIIIILLAAGLGGPAGCFGPLAKRLADKEVYGLVKDKQQQLFGTPKPFSIEPTTTSLTQDVIQKAGFSSDQFTTKSLTLSLSDALALAIDNSREYKTRKEQVYLTALTLTAERHKYSPIFSDTISAQATRQPGAPLIAGGSPTVERFGELTNNLGVTKLFATGARVTVGLSDNFLKYYTGAKPDTATGVFTASFVQPLLQGAGPGVVEESLIQADRNMVYSLRDFERYQRKFVLDRVSQYYRLLQARDQIDNEYASYKRLIVSRERAQAMEDAQRMAAFQVDQASQDEFSARNRWLTARTDYALQLDQFKVDLGMPPEINIQPDPAELGQLQKKKMVELQYDISTAQQMAVKQRLDLMTAKDQFIDASRKVMIAENSLLPAVNATASLTVPDTGQNQPFDFDWKRRVYSGGLNIELPLDRKQQRNDYRTALIAREQAQRDRDQLRDNVIIQVREAYQNANQARQSYDIQIAGLELAKKRVDNVQLLMDIGRADVSIRDQLDAESSLRDAQNAVTRVLVDFTISRLQFYNAIEDFKINDRGMWKDES